VNARYHDVILEAIPPGCKNALDVGCGNGLLTRALANDRKIPQVVGLDRHGPCVERSKAHPESGGIGYVRSDLLAHPFRPKSFDLVTSVAALHHMDPRAGLTRLRDLVAPGGVLAIIGLARPDLPKDLPIEVAGLIANLFRPDPKVDPSQRPPIVWPPLEPYAAVRRLAAELLPGFRWRRHLRWRYSLVWTCPA
jgi:2-polyprenyl-3-methyl-5-hydroxy-6-metoxy-1,4-benzoquinol methylase